MSFARWFVPAYVAAATLGAQTLRVYSEFIRVDPAGQIVPADAIATPREILSPALVRNGFTSFQIVITDVRPHADYFLFVGSNPPDVFRTTIYKEQFVAHGEARIPDRLTPARMPDYGVIPDPDAGIAGQTTRAYLLDVWVPADVPPGRVRLEVQLKSGGWVVWPMEVRVLPALVPERTHISRAPLPDITVGAAEAAWGALAGLLPCPHLPDKPALGRPPQTVREIIRRNAEQDAALACSVDQKLLAPALQQKTPEKTDEHGYLHIRDMIYRLASAALPNATR